MRCCHSNSTVSQEEHADANCASRDPTPPIRTLFRPRRHWCRVDLRLRRRRDKFDGPISNFLHRLFRASGVRACSHARRRPNSASLRKYAAFLSAPFLSHPSSKAWHPAAMTRGNKSSCRRRRRRGSHARRPCLSLASISMFPLFYICVMF